MLQVVMNEKHYRPFIKYAVGACGSFSLVFEKDDGQSSLYVLQEIYLSIAEFVMDKKSIGEHPDTGSSFQHSDIVHIECNKFTSTVLKNAYSVFDWNGELLPEELCFYRNGEKWFVCISHEKCSFIYCENNDDLAFLKKEKIEYWHE